MKKFVIAVVLFVIIAGGMSVFAESSKRNESEYYYVNITLEKVWPYRAGYIVQYRKGLGQLGRLYIPNEWFTKSAGKAEIIGLPKGPNWPSISVYYKEGEFSHLRLYVHRWHGHESWGVVPQNVNIDSQFDDIETLKVQFR